jgi:hypothetical protein
MARKSHADLKMLVMETANGKTAIGDCALRFVIIFPFSS